MKGIILFLLLAIITASCADDTVEEQICYEGTVIGKIRSGGGGVAVTMETAVMSSHEWNGFQHVIEALNIPVAFWVPGQKIFFTGRPGTEEEKGYITADGAESDKPLVYVLTFSTTECP